MQQRVRAAVSAVAVERLPAAGRTAGVTAMLQPRSVVVLGASAKKVASGNQALANLQRRGFDGQLHVVHPVGDEIQGVPAVPSVSDLPGDIDCALVSLPAAAVVPVLRELERIGCRSAIVPTAGLTTDDLREYETLATSSRMAIHGPNSMGLLNLTDDLPLWFYDGMFTDEPSGDVALVSQSGSACLFIARSAPRARFSKIISSGNELGVTTADYLSWLADDPATRSAGVVIESLRDARGFVSAVAKMRAAGKPLAVLRAGRSAVGGRMTVAHTGALVGDDEAYRVLFDELDVPTVDDYDEMASLLECWARRVPPTRGADVAVVTISGGQAALAADIADAKGVRIAELAPETAARLEDLSDGSTGINPFDAGADDLGAAEYDRCIQILAADSAVDAVIAVLDAQDSLNDAELLYTRELSAPIAALGPVVNGKPLLVSSSSSLGIHPDCRRWFGDVLVMRGIPNALVALRCLAMNQRPVADRRSQLVVSPDDDDGLQRLREQVRAARGALPAAVAGELLELYGLPLVRTAIVTGVDAALAFAAETGYPVVAKVSSPDVPHRADVGGVITGIQSADALRHALAEIETNVRHALPAATIDGFEVQEHVGDSLEAAVGYVTDPVLGATMLVGCGGALIELVDDKALGLAPLDTPRAHEMIAATRLAALAGGYRRLVPETPLDGLADVLVRLSALAHDLGPLLSEGDLNPVLIEHRTGRARIVDALLVAPPSAGPGEEDS